jgi:hypothetical protein
VSAPIPDPRSSVPCLDARAVWEDYPSFRRSPENPWLYQPGDLDRFLDWLLAEKDCPFIHQIAAHSEEGRPIHRLAWGTGSTSIMVWAQQHGDEPLCAMALLDFLAFVGSRADAPLVRALRDGLTLHIVPMVNPDGVARFTRQNAQGIDVNRDARLRQTVSSRVLRRLWEECHPSVCFNLHDQFPRKSTSDRGDLIALSVQACPFDQRETLAPHLLRAKRLCGVIADALAPWIAGHIARYDSAYMDRCFGDTMSRWGVCSVLIESGGWFGAPPEADAFVVRCHFLALLAGLAAVATGSEREVPPERYDQLPLEGTSFCDLTVRGPVIFDGTGAPPHRGDIGLNVQIDHRRGGVRTAKVQEVGDLSNSRAKIEIDGEGLIATPGLVAFVPEFTPDSLQDSQRIRSLHRRGITAVVGHWNSRTSESSSQPTLEAPLRALFVEDVADLDEAARRHFQTEAHGLRLHCPSVEPDSLQDVVTPLPLKPVSVDLILVCRGRPSANAAFLLLSPPPLPLRERGLGGEGLRLDLAPLRAVFGQWIWGALEQATSDPQLLSAPPPVVLLTPHAESAPHDVIRSLMKTFDLDPPSALKLLTTAPLAALGLQDLERIQPKAETDVLLWDREAPNPPAPFPTGEGGEGIGPLRRVIAAGQVVDLE